MSALILYCQRWWWQPLTRLIIRWRYDYVCVFCYVPARLMMVQVNVNLLIDDKIPVTVQRRYHGYWCSQDARIQGISSYVLLSYIQYIYIYTNTGTTRFIQNDKCIKCCVKSCHIQNTSFMGKGSKTNYVLININLPLRLYETKGSISIH